MWEPLALARMVDIQHPALVPSDDISQKVLPVGTKKERLTDARTRGLVRIRELMGDPSRQHLSITEVVEMIVDGRIGALEGLCQFASSGVWLRLESSTQ